MKKALYLILILGIFISSVNYGQETEIYKGLQAINTDVIKAQLGFLASDWMEGREAGKRGELLASDYIASMLQLYGVKPCGDFTLLRSPEGIVNARSYFQNFVILKTTPGKNNYMQVKSKNGDAVRTTDFISDVDLRCARYPILLKLRLLSYLSDMASGMIKLSIMT